MTDERTAAWDPSPPGAYAATAASGGVVAAGVILLVIATLLGIFGILAILGGAMIGQISNLSGQTGLTEEQANALMTVGRAFIFVLGGVAVAIGLAHLLSGIGVLRRRGWARILGLVMSVLGVLVWLLVLVSSGLAAVQPIPAGYLQDSGLTVEEYRSIAGAGWIIGIVFAAIGLAAYTYVLVVLIRRGREFA
ncbi:MAG: hypothetical protein ABI458_02560 [Chloroflexota bacterium]